MAKNEKWRLIEGVVEALERGGAPDAAVITRNAAVSYRTEPSRTRQVDIHVAVPAGPRIFTAGIEVKDEKAPLSVEVVEQIDAKLSKLQLDHRCLVSRSGFSEGGRKDAVPGGLVLLTLEQLGSVSWWWGPMTMLMRRNRVQVVGVNLLFRDPEIATRAAGLPVQECLVVDSRGKTATLYDYGVHHGIHALKDPRVQVLGDGIEFAVELSSPRDTAETWAWAGLRHKGIEFPKPMRIAYRYKLHRSLDLSPLDAFGLHDRQALTTSFPFIDGKEFQLTLVGQEGEIPGSIGDLKLVVGPVKVPKKKV